MKVEAPRKKTLGALLRKQRAARQLTQRQLAAMLGVQAAHIAYLEQDRRRPSLSLLSRIAEVLELDSASLILLSHPEARSFIVARRPLSSTARKDQAWREFKGNKGLLAQHRVSKNELQVLSKVALLGKITAPRSFLFILNSIRQAVEDEG
jgi:transcriptional regulator with XRE-family HTH domain